MSEQSEQYDILNKYIDEIHRCYRCGLCRTVCPSFEATGIETVSPRGRVQFARAVLEGRLKLDRAVEDRMLDCLNCMRCVESCPAGVRTDRIVLAARAELVKRGRLPGVKRAAFNVLKHPAITRAAAALGATGQRMFYQSSRFLRQIVPRFMGMGDKNLPNLAERQAHKQWPEVVPAQGERIMRVGYFIGCATNLLFPEVADATIRVLTRNGVEVVIPPNQACCGIPVYSSGDQKTARGMAEHNRHLFAKYDFDCIVTDCASCSAALKHDVHDLLDVDLFTVPVYDLTEFLARIIDIDRDFGDVPMRVTYHDPCHLKRGQDISEEPRDLLRMTPGVEFIEMEGADRCCGGAGTLSFTHHELSRQVGARKIESVRNTGAAVVSTPCPSCRMQLNDLIAHDGVGAVVMHPVEILDLAYRNAGVEDRETGAVGARAQ